MDHQRFLNLAKVSKFSHKEMSFIPNFLYTVIKCNSTYSIVFIHRSEELILYENGRRTLITDDFEILCEWINESVIYDKEK